MLTAIHVLMHRSVKGPKILEVLTFLPLPHNWHRTAVLVTQLSCLGSSVGREPDYNSGSVGSNPVRGSSVLFRCAALVKCIFLASIFLSRMHAYRFENTRRYSVCENYLFYADRVYLTVNNSVNI